ncbi:MAG: hypothetical protein ACI86H_002657 [bacterium]|jgi:hypothetical protein
MSDVFEHIVHYLDVVLQKERTNQEARADIIVDGVTLAKEVPATFLLGLETKIRQWKTLLEEIPTPAQGIAWEKDETRGDGIYKMAHPEKKFRTGKTYKSKVLYEATEKHPAQIKEWEEAENIGMYITER